ncbi:MAG: NAD(P)/FAD-dependent oxidoreductase [Hyphomicrobiales bacterium]|nr:NAD(P)/FAD-dependent oxidoreductase [Acidobacteriaceae bacterium]MBV9755046.1 NAD(P)/FAD-dependent oxidoreductase [Hyphomicrobiales bacterium]
MKTYDAVVVGAGHNGLVAASYLARNGLSILVVERSDRIGGACITTEIIPGFKVSMAAQLLGMLRQRIIDDLELERHGLHFRFRDPEIFVPFPDGQHAFFYPDVARTVASLAGIAPKDAASYAQFDDHTTRIARIVGDFMLRPQPTMAQFAAAFNAPDGAQMLNSVLFSSIADYLERFFESDYVQGPMAYGAMSGSDQSPYAAGTAFSKFYHGAAELGGRFGHWAIVEGGMGCVTQALARALHSYGGIIRLEAPVSQILFRHGRAAGVVLENGEEIEAAAVLSNADPKTTLLKLTPRAALDEELRGRVARLKAKGSGVKINFALAELPDFKSLPGKTPGPQHRGGIMIAPSLDYYDRAWDEARRGLPATSPFSQMVIQSATDPTVAPEGKHTLSLWCHHFPYALAEGDIDNEREKIADRMTDILTDLAPNFRASVLARQIFVPVDIERVYGIEGGQIFHTELVPEQVLWNRPIPGHSGHGDLVPGLYLCGAGTHPGGDVNGAPGFNAARALLGDIAGAQLKRS